MRSFVLGLLILCACAPSAFDGLASSQQAESDHDDGADDGGMGRPGPDVDAAQKPNGPMDGGLPPDDDDDADAADTTENPDADMPSDVDVDADMPNNVDASVPSHVDADTPEHVDTGMPIPPDPLPPDIGTGSPVYYFQTWKTATGFCRPTPQTDSTSCGQLLAGRNYFYCQKRTAESWQEGEYVNDWWLYTDLDTPKGAHGWISAVYVTVGGNYEPIPGLPECMF